MRWADAALSPDIDDVDSQDTREAKYADKRQSKAELALGHCSVFSIHERKFRQVVRCCKVQWQGARGQTDHTFALTTVISYAADIDGY